MSFINWETTFDFTLPPPLPPIELDIPTYGLNGGAGYTAGEFTNVAPAITDTPVGVDALDLLFFSHDVASGQATALINPFDPSTVPLSLAAQAQADYQLLQGIEQLNGQALRDPEASLYAGGAELATIALLELNPVGVDLTPKELKHALKDAVHNIESGLKHLDASELQQVQGFVADVSTALDAIHLQPSAILQAADIHLPKLHHHTVDLLV
jgi:hypothetical protein